MAFPTEYPNLLLPICPKCGDTQTVIKAPSGCLRIQFCTECKIEWTPYDIKELDPEITAEAWINKNACKILL